ncbi:cytochrome P450/oxidoreductase [Nocardioides bruguierae]|uniref:Cytochrome P450/oxidoreductase n=1 Tax=Nocardioides bruguierae TaxID=2945102 RepID=A0A9X2D7N9_9ACTN|nr:cytochrome P450 [Nocardioides bruguierae]MCM0620865.1 cytochrome P450/oxidoreductase [Nocardioides bruguierae]
MTTVVPEYNPFAPGFYDDPFPTYAWMRDAAPVFHSERWGWYALSRFEDVRTAILDADTFRSFEGMDLDDTAHMQLGPGSLPNTDNPRHDKIRAIVQPWFTPRRIGGLEEPIRQVVRNLVAQWRERGSADLAAELAWPMPFDVFFTLMGLPIATGEERERLEGWVHGLKGRVPGTPHLTDAAVVDTAAITQYFRDLLQERKERPADDLVSLIAHAEIDGVPFAPEDIDPASEVLGLMMVLFLGGVESTAGLTATTLKLLAENPDQRELVRADPTLIPQAIEEAVRWATPLQLTARTTSRDVHLHGQVIPQGSRVALVTGAANRDERRFPDADRYDVTRGLIKHVGFGEGVHGCLGAPLARLEVRIALEEALPVLGDYELDGAPTFYPSSVNMYCWQHLPVTFTPPAAETQALDGKREETASTALTEHAVVVEEKVEAADGVVAITLRADSVDGRLPSWAPGAHVDVVAGDAPVRQYSLCGDVEDRGRYRIGVLREPASRGGSAHLHEGVSVGDRLVVRGPRNHFALSPSPRYLFLAGGIGITPILPMIAAAEAAGAEWQLVYGGRTKASMAFLDELAVHGDKVRLVPQDTDGHLPLAELLGTPLADTQVYVCGPGPLLDAVEESCAHWPSGSLHLERFAPREDADLGPARPFEVQLVRTGVTLHVPADRSALDVVHEAGVDVLSSCAEGTCGTCETRVLEGEVEHRDSVLEPAERAAQDCMMLCVSRACSDRLVLDL